MPDYCEYIQLVRGYSKEAWGKGEPAQPSRATSEYLCAVHLAIQAGAAFAKTCVKSPQTGNFPSGPVVKSLLPSNAGDAGSILGRGN